MLDATQAAFNALRVVRKRNQLFYVVGEGHQIDPVLLTQQRLHEAPGCIALEPVVSEDTLAGVDGEYDLERRRRLLVEDGNPLRAAVFG